jgi:protein farnesyltransferase/geranylgeranyltransferase type-1 subunit alpha
LQLSALEIQHSLFLEKKEREKGKWLDSKTNEAVVVTADEVEEEKLRRKEIARLRMELYGERTGEYGTDPAWDDIIPMPIEEPEGALAAIAYPEEYAEGPIDSVVKCNQNRTLTTYSNLLSTSRDG